MSYANMSSEQQVASLTPVVEAALEAYGLSGFSFESINHEYNSTFALVGPDGQRFALRVNVNSNKSLKNLKAEVEWVRRIANVQVPSALKRLDGSFVSQIWHEASGRVLDCVVYSWLNGEEPGDEPTLEQVTAMGVALAKLHEQSVGFEFSEDAALPDYNDFYWGAPDYLLGEASELSSPEKSLVQGAKTRIEQVLAELYGSAKPQPIHADLHSWNVMWFEGELAVFDFDDAGIGLPVQDLANAMYHLDTPEQDQALIDGYRSVRALPEYKPEQLALLLLQRRIMLLNYLYETTNPEHREMIPEYQAETFKRIRNVLG
jgi:Ser/Thr protein kinase RdoA (MazF antagonist)